MIFEWRRNIANSDKLSLAVRGAAELVNATLVIKLTMQAHGYDLVAGGVLINQSTPPVIYCSAAARLSSAARLSGQAIRACNNFRLGRIDYTHGVYFQAQDSAEAGDAVVVTLTEKLDYVLPGGQAEYPASVDVQETSIAGQIIWREREIEFRS